MRKEPGKKRLYPGEKLVAAAGYPALMKFVDGGESRPLVVFITGGGVLARIAYGHPEGSPRDFLAHWLAEAGHPFLALSYPIDNPVFDSVHPAFSVRDWGAQSAEIVAKTVKANRLPTDVVVLAWSMAGRIAEPLGRALARHGIGVELFVAMAASAPTPGLQPGLDRIRPAANGLGDLSGGFLDWLVGSLDGQRGARGTSVVAEDQFRAEFTGNVPVNLCATALRYGEHGFFADGAADLADTGALNYAGFPPLAAMTHRSVTDARHALGDRGAWGFYISQTLCERFPLAQAGLLGELPKEAWNRLTALIAVAPGELTATVSGNHLFFVGERGAQETVEALGLLRARARRLHDALREIAEIAEQGQERRSAYALH